MAIEWLTRALEIRNEAMAEGKRPTDVSEVDAMVDAAIESGLTARELRDAGREAARRAGR